MKKFFVTKRHDINEEHVFYLEKILDANNHNITSDFDTSIRFIDDDQLSEFLSKIFETNQDEIEIIEEGMVEYTSTGKNITDLG
jgi:hypothetical protein